mmetsp:Transcript_43216/g.113510  ORF Transcript_43216/g.113510 Transcript_43216/m.113510 type:complete len:282 (-) Transcript_43216:250-1095(-)
MADRVMAVLAPVLLVLESLSNLGLAGKLGYLITLSVWTVLCLPTTPIELTAGFCFDKVTAIVASASGKTLGNMAALLIGRAYLQPFIMRQLSSRAGGSSLHQHLLHELRENPIQTMSVLRAAPLPTPLKLYGLSLFPAELVTVRRYAIIALVFNLLWSLVWTLAGSSASSMADVLSGSAKEGSHAVLATQVMWLLVLLGGFSMLGRFAMKQLKPPPKESKPKANGHTNGFLSTRSRSPAVVSHASTTERRVSASPSRRKSVRSGITTRSAGRHARAGSVGN